MSQWKIDPEFQELIPAMEPQQLDQLRENILRDGVRDPIVIWEEESTIIDGMHRYQIALEHDVQVPLKLLHFDSREDVKEWMIKNQLGRRNCKPIQQSDLRKKLVELRKKEQPQKTQQQVIEEVAEEANVSVKTLERDVQEEAAGSNGKAPKTQKEGKAPKKSNKPVPSLAKIDEDVKRLWGQLVRLMDTRLQKTGPQDEHRARPCRHLLGDFMEKFEEWQKSG